MLEISFLRMHNRKNSETGELKLHERILFRPSKQNRIMIHTLNK